MADEFVPCEQTPPERPAIDFYRWQEDWSVLADLRIKREPGDELKYIPLWPGDPQSYLSFGITSRQRIETTNAALFGIAGNRSETYLLDRLELHADLHLTDHFRLFAEIESAFAPGLANPNPVDSNPLDMRLLFLDMTGTFLDGEYKLRIGRQEIAFDLQRFVSVRDGPNVRQAYDAVWGDYEKGGWRLTGFLSQPVQYRNEMAFEDYSDKDFTFCGVRLQRVLFEVSKLALSFSDFHQGDVKFPAASGAERRFSWDVHYFGAARGFDWDIEGVTQSGSIGEKRIDAWALGSLAGYSFAEVPWQPRFGLQLDAASGDRGHGNQTFGTFNPLFPNGYYVTLSGFTGYTNFIHVKPSLSLNPVKNVKVVGSLGELWRQTTRDAVYVQPDVPVPGTAGQSGRRSSTYGQLCIDWDVTRSLSVSLEYDHYEVAEVIRRAGGHDSDYLGVQFSWGW